MNILKRREKGQSGKYKKSIMGNFPWKFRTGNKKH